MQLSDDILEVILHLVTSKERSIICSVSSQYHRLAIRVSRRLSATPELYDWPQWVNPPKGLAKKISMDDYHLIVRLKSTRGIKFTRICKGPITQDRLDVCDLGIDQYLHPYDIRHKTFKLACKSGSVELVNRFIKDQDYIKIKPIDAIMYACSKGHIEIVKLLMGMINSEHFDIDWCLMKAYKHNHIAVVNFLKEQHAYNQACWNGQKDTLPRFYGMCAGGQLQLIDGIDISIYDLNWGLGLACSHGQKESIKIVVAAGASVCVHCQRNAIDHL